MKNEKENTDIPRHHKDITFYCMSSMFRDEIIDFFNLNLPRVKDIIQTRVPYISIKDQHMDVSFILEDDTVAHFEYESDTITEDDLIRYGHYDLELYKERRTKIHRIVVFAAGVTTAPKPLRFRAVSQDHT